jgi:hypothetical protein
MKMKMLQRSPTPKAIVINTAEFGGGTEFIARSVWRGLIDRGWDAWMLVGSKKSDHPKVMTFHESQHIDYRPYSFFAVQALQARRKRIARNRGYEDFHFPFSRRVLEPVPKPCRSNLFLFLDLCSPRLRKESGDGQARTVHHGRAMGEDRTSVTQA